MTKQTFTSGQVLTAAQMNTLQANDYNWSVNAKTANYIIAASDVGTRITMNSATATTVTINTATLAAGDSVYILNIGTGTCTITAGAGTTVATANSLVLPQNAGGYLFANSSTAFYFLADGVNNSYASIASASSIAITNRGNYLLTGTTTTATITGGSTGQVITLTASGQAAGSCVVLTHGTGSNAISLRDSLSLGIYAGESVTLFYDGTKWVEVNRNLKDLLASNERTTNYTTTTSYASVISGTAITFDGTTPIIIEVFSSRVRAGGTGTVEMSIYDGASSVGIVGTVENGNTNGMSVPVLLRFRITPTAGSHTYNLYAIHTTAGGTIYGGAGGAATIAPAAIRVYRDL